ncbi:hypothetical protein F383_03874 [Gossypium arboreum]|uniref:Uncharacterized protein n=1 Tax=Gossypium arboreum TaxID=29729 RepID=A0A0B0PFU6_GOSAR|nr:hypothetical protein F383_03874 [Gossypium arboreum]
MLPPTISSPELT